jgi:SAM-dependent methyltransferase
MNHEWIQLLAPRSPMRLVEIGSGPGLLAEELGTMVNFIRAIDLSPRMTAHARKHHILMNGEFITGDVRDDSTWGREKADLILGASILNVIPDRVKLMDICSRHLAPNGKLSFLFPNPSMTVSRAKQYCKEHGIRGFSREFLLLWAASARKLDPQTIYGYWPGEAVTLQDLLGGMVSTMTGYASGQINQKKSIEGSK